MQKGISVRAGRVSVHAERKSACMLKMIRVHAERVSVHAKIELACMLLNERD
jgi:hypothetical protein